MRMRRIILQSSTCPARPHVSTLPNKRRDFWGKKIIEHKMCVLIFSTIILNHFSFLEELSEM